MKFRFVAIISTILVIYTMINYYISWNGAVFLKHAFHMHPTFLYWIIFWIIAFSYIVSRLFNRFLNATAAFILKVVGSYWFAVMVYATILLPIADLLYLVVKLVGWKDTNVIPALGYVTLVLLALILWRGFWNARTPMIRKHSITIAKPAGSYEELRVVVASDLHLSTVVGIKHLTRLVKLVNIIHPDLVLLVGDVIDDDIEPYKSKHMSEMMKQLKAQLGVYAVLGNHEYIGGHIEAFAAQMEQSHVQLLMDETVKIAGSFYLIGRKDRAVKTMAKGSRMDIAELLTGVDKSLPLILMDHQPYDFDIALSNGIDLMLSGHTHRGQMAPYHWITRRLFELDWGYLLKGSMHVVVSSGFGTWGPPIRLGSRCELIELMIKFEPAQGE